MADLSTTPHRRLNPLTDEWVLVSPQRTQRPWQGQVESQVEEIRPAHDASCYLCPGNSRTGDNRNPVYEGTFVFDNDFPALLAESTGQPDDSHPLFQTEVERGVCRVMCFSPRHDWTLAHMPVEHIRRVVDTWAEQTAGLAIEYPWLRYVQLFENKGEMMGCSNPHPHGQIWATEHLPREIQKEEQTQRRYFQDNEKTLLSEILIVEQQRQSRIVYTNDDWTVLVPFWAVWPYETLIVSHHPRQWMTDLTEIERNALAEALASLTVRYDNLFQMSFPYSMGIHQAPVNQGAQPHWHLHIHFYPPLLRSATVKKHMVGYEMLATPQRDITAEYAADRLRKQSSVRFSRGI